MPRRSGPQLPSHTLSRGRGQEVIATKWFNARHGYGFTNRNDTREDDLCPGCLKEELPQDAPARCSGGTVRAKVVEGEKGAGAANVTGQCTAVNMQPTLPTTCHPHRRVLQGPPRSYQQSDQNSEMRDGKVLPRARPHSVGPAEATETPWAWTTASQPSCAGREMEGANPGCRSTW